MKRRRFSPAALRLPLCFCAALFCCAPLLLCACRRPPQPDLFLLRDDIKKEAPQYAFDPAALFYRDGVYYVYYSLHDENDLLLTLRENEYGKVDRATLTALRGGNAAKTDLPAFALLLARLLLPGCDTGALEQSLGLQKLSSGTQKAAAAGAPAAFYTCGKYRAALYCGETACCFLAEKREEEETTVR